MRGRRGRSQDSRPGLRKVLAADLQRYGGARGRRAFLRTFFSTPGFRYTAVLRFCQALCGRRGARPFFVLASLWLSRLGRLYGISISVGTRIAPGFYIGHFGGIVVHGDTVIGPNCNISQGVTIGQTNRGERRGVPVIGSEVYLGPGAKIIGGITIGDGAAIGANAVVTRDVPPNGVAVGVPARIVSTRGSEGYIDFPVAHA